MTDAVPVDDFDVNQLEGSFTIHLDGIDDFAHNFITKLVPRGAAATVIRLHGDLGAGKTTFVAAMARAMGVTVPITSPTFVIQKSYPVQHAQFSHLIHIDAYRLDNGADLDKLRFREYLSDPTHIICIEWPDIVADVLPANGYRIALQHAEVDENIRICTVSMI